ncbi:MAG: 7-carboxy-7-deazaguanine synthase QueE [Phycisphaerae bacterium]|nr:7-carboxy-7-deazaguanine synthase QueE [Phycisphaerae bacterium]
MIINELFYSLQGEGRLAGVPSVFVRLAGCPLRCCWCDTAYAWDPAAGREMSCKQILDAIGNYPTRYAVLTGGEPLAHEGVSELAAAIRSAGYHLTIETAGIYCIEGLQADLMSISPKLSNSDPQKNAEKHQVERLNVDTLRKLTAEFDYQLKFVADSPGDLDEIADVLDKLGEVDPYRVYLMPQATQPEEYLTKSRWLVEYCKQAGFSFSPRLHIMLWGSQRGK